jgi:cyclohexa-1,5-dienecarbonyl-CoA hydratase
MAGAQAEERSMSSDPVRLEKLEGGSVWRVLLATPKANILDIEKSEILASIFERAAGDAGLKAVVLEGEGPHFCFGASVQEHLPDRCAAMLRSFHGLFRKMLEAPVVTLAAVRGQCLGGGLELAAFCHRIFADPGARLGQPEIVLGVFAPVASILLTERMGRGGAEDLLLSGRSLPAEEACRLGLVDEIAENPGEAALAYARSHLLPRSASSLRWAVRAARQGFARRFLSELAEVERIYLEELMRTSDALEGLQAFLEKRPPQWRNA